MSHSSCLAQTDPCTEPQQGIGARLVRQLGGAVRRAITGGIGLSSGRRHSTAGQPASNPAAARDLAVSRAPGPKPRARRPRTAAAVQPSRPQRSGWLAPLRRRCHRRIAGLGRGQFPDTGVVLFTPEAFPALSPEACAFLNTPLEECDPDILLFLFSNLTQYLTDLPADAETPDPMAVFATLWARLGEIRGDAASDALPAEAPAEAPAAPVTPPVTPPETDPPTPLVSMDALPGTSSPTPGEGLPHLPPVNPAQAVPHATGTSVAVPVDPSLRHCSIPFSGCGRRFSGCRRRCRGRCGRFHRCCGPCRRGRASVAGRVFADQQRPLPLPHRCYTARASPA